VANLKEHLRELLLKISREDRVADRQADDRELPCPSPLRACATELAVERKEL
jgi:hypothetical protein